MADAGDVNAARRNVGRHEYLDLAIAECLQRSRTLALRFVAMDRGGLDTGTRKPTHNAVGAMLCAGEDQRPVNLFALQFERQQCLLFALLDKGHELFNALCCGRGGRNRNTHRIVQKTVAKLGNRLWHGRRKEQCLTLFWQ